ncbi:MAG: mandelate racemase/muconate lactonizing enzyme family protein [Verrucomicrobiae bacterium]|nr:mandelate racemase/muconate lactonizing enzyme family protein [Verrucomicrobiae bacterium]
MDRIDRVEAMVVAHRLQRTFHFSQWHYDTRSVCLVKVTTRDGVVGWGEGYGPAGVVRAGVEFLAPLVVGEDPLQGENLWQRMFLRSVDYARRGVLVAAISAIDVALWDVRGRLLGLPVSVLLGGRRRESVRAYATGMYFSEAAGQIGALAREARGYADAGFSAIKMKVGLSVQEDIANVGAVREAVGEGVELMVDANHAYNLREAVALARAIEPFRIGWFEEPLSPEDYEGYRELRDRTTIPIAAGECEYLRSGFLQLFRNRSVDVAQPDLCAAGGLTEVKKIAAMAEAFGVEVAPHSWGTGIAIAAALQLLSNMDVAPGRMKMAEPILELDRTENPLRDELVVPRFEPRGGRVDVPAAPGLGVEVDEALLGKYRQA